MSDSVNIDWGLTQNQPNYTQGALQGYQGGAAVGQQQATRSALNSYDPAAPDGALTALIRAGASDQASSIVGLGRQRASLDVFQRGAQGYENVLSGGGAASQPANTAPNSASVADPASQSPLAAMGGTVDAAHERAISDTDQLLSLPYEQRRAKIQTFAPDYQAIGILPQAIQDFVPTDTNLSTIKSNLTASRASLAAPPAPGGLNIHNPQLQASIGLMAMGGAPVGPIVDMAKANTSQYVKGPADTVLDSTYGTTGNPIPKGADGSQIIQGVDGRWYSVPIVGGADAIKTAAMAEAGGKAAGELPYAGARAQAEATGTGMGKLATELIPVPDGKGGTVMMTGMQYEKAVKSGAAPAGLGQTLNPGQEQFAKDDAAAFSKLQSTVADPVHLQELQREAVIGQRIAGLARSAGVGPGTGALSDIARVAGPMLGNKNLTAYGTNGALLEQDLASSIRTEFGASSLPRIKSEFQTVMQALPHDTSPTDKIGIYGAMKTARANQELAYGQFVSQYPNASARGVQAAWNNGPGRTSFLADPVFRGQTLNGNPVVAISPKQMMGPDKIMHTYGVFMPGTPGHQTFMVQ